MKIPHEIECQSSRPDLPLPSATYLGIHAACCKLAHMSGAADQIEKMENYSDSFSPDAPSDEFAACLAAKLYDISASVVSVHVDGENGSQRKAKPMRDD